MITNAKRTYKSVLHLTALLVIAIVTTLQVPLAQPMTDGFQEGEYATFGFLEQTRPGFHMPVLIHGGLDVVPSRIAALTCRAESQVICVRTINALTQFGSTLLFVALVAILAGLGTDAALFASLPAAAMLWFYDGPTVSIVDAQQGTPGARDVFVMAGLLLMVGLCRRWDRHKDGEGARAGIASLAVLGFLSVVGVFWAYNRGLALGVVAGLFTVGFCVLRRSVKPLLFVAFGGCAGLAIMLAAGRITLLADTLFNMQYWSQNGAIWHTSLSLRTVGPALVLAAVVLIGAVAMAWQRFRTGQFGAALVLAVLALTYVIYFGQSLNRPDVQHMRWVVWPATLILAILIRWMTDGVGTAGATDVAATRATHFGRTRLVVLLLVAGACIESYSDNSILHAVLAGLKDNIRVLAHGAPTDRELAGDDLDRVADLVNASGHCTFAANNAGIVHLLSRTSPCSRFAFGTYIAADRQTEVIAALETAQPSIILWDSSNWYSRIDSRNFHDRTPVLASWIESHYPVRTVIGQQVLLSRTPLTP